MLAFLAMFAFGYVVHGANDTRDPPLASGALVIGKPTHPHPAGLTISPLNQVLMRGALRTGRIQHCRVVRPKPFGLARMHQVPHLLDRYLVSRNIKNFFKSRIP
jgi:hypothetical protein